MFSTGKIGLWSIIEEGIGIIAGSLPSLRPLLSLPFLNGSSTGKSSERDSACKLKNLKRRSQVLRSDTNIDTFQQLQNTDGDGDSQRHILKETQVTVTNEPSGGPGEWERSQAPAWQQSKFGC